MTALLARRQVVAPTWEHAPDYVDTFGPEVCELSTAAGFEPYPEQAHALDLIFAVDSRGRSAAFEVDVIASRQQLKTGLIIQAKIGWLFVTDQQLVVYTAHDGTAVSEAHRKLGQIILGSPALSKRLRPGPSKGILSGKSDLSIELRTGQRAVYMIRTPDNGRSLAGDKVVIDEGYAYTDAQAGALEPTMAAVADPQLLLASSAGKTESKRLRDARDRGRAGTDPRQVYLEWGDREAWSGCEGGPEGEDCDHAKTAEGCALDDETRWATIMPRLDRQRIEVVRSLRKSMPPLEFAREFLVWWDDPTPGSALVMPRWPSVSLGTEVAEGNLEPTQGLTFGVACSIDQEWTSVGAAAGWEDGRVHVGAVYRSRGTAGAMDYLGELADQGRCPEVVLDRRGPAYALKGDLEALGVRVRTHDTDEVCTDTALLVTGVRDGLVTHSDYPELNDAVRSARTRPVGDRYAWGRKTGDVSMLESVTLAHGVVRQSMDYDVAESVW